MYIDIGYIENKHTDTYIVYIHIYSWDKAAHPPALASTRLYTVFGKKSNNYVVITVTRIRFHRCEPRRRVTSPKMQNEFDLAPACQGA